MTKIMAKFEANIADRVRQLVRDDVLRAQYGYTGEAFYVLEDSDPDYGLLTQRYGRKRVFSTLLEAYNIQHLCLLKYNFSVWMGLRSLRYWGT